MTSEAKELTGRELDAEVHRSLGLCTHDWHYQHEWNGWTWACLICALRSDLAETTPRYSTDIAAAWKVVEAMMARGLHIGLTNWPSIAKGPWSATFVEDSEHIGDTAPEAICRAALAALRAEADTK